MTYYILMFIISFLYEIFLNFISRRSGKYIKTIIVVIFGTIGILTLIKFSSIFGEGEANIFEIIIYVLISFSGFIIADKIYPDEIKK